MTNNHKTIKENFMARISKLVKAEKTIIAFMQW